MANNLREMKKRLLEERRANVLEEYQAANDQLSRELSAVNEKRIKRQIEKLEADLREIETELAKISPISVTPDKPAPPDETEPVPDGPSPLPTADSEPGIFERIGFTVKRWLWVQFLLWTVVSVNSVVSNLAGVFDLSLCTRLALTMALVFLGGSVILIVSFLPSQRSKHQRWDWALTGVMLVVVTVVLIWIIAHNCVPTPLPPPTATSTHTPSPAPTFTSTLTPSPASTEVFGSNPPQPVEVGSLIYFDDFESSPNKWRIWSDGDGRAWYENSAYNVRSYASKRGWISIKLNDPYDNLILEVDAIPITHELVTGYAVAFGWVEGENYYIFEVQAGGECGFITVKNKRRVAGATSKTLCPKPVQDEKVRVRLEINQQKAVAFINGSFAGLKVWLESEPYGGGNIGLGAHNSGELGSGAQAQVRFDNLAIWRFKVTSSDYPYGD
jgi:hypothetical protein